MIEERYSVIYFLVVFDINLDVTLCSLLRAGFSAVPAVFLVAITVCVRVYVCLQNISKVFNQSTSCLVASFPLTQRRND